MNIADLSIKRPVFAWMLMSALIIFGAISFMRLGVSAMPDVDFPILDITVAYEGAAPSVIETDLVLPIEGRVISVEGVKEIKSTIRQGSASVRLEFEIGRNIDSALQEVQAALSQLKMPKDVDPPVIKKSNPEEDPILFVGVASTHSLRNTIRYADLVLLDRLQTVSGVGEVNVGGFSVRNLRIWIDQKKLARHYLTVLDIADAIQYGHSELASGVIENEKTSTNLRSMGEAYSPEEVGNIWIRSRGGEVIKDPVVQIKDVARVEDGLSDIRRVANISGQPGLSVGVKKQRGSNEVEVSRALRAKIEEINKDLPEGYRLQVNADFTRSTEQVVNTTNHKLIFAALITGLICFLFLGSWSSSLNVLLSIPTSIFGTFIVMYFAGFTLNLFTLLALTLAISIVVDDAIMMLENIIRHFKMGKSRKQAASDGAREIWLAALAATIAVVAIFLPVIFMRGIIGKFFFQFGVTISTAVLLSLLESVTLTPMRCSQFMRRSDDENWLGLRSARLFNWLSKWYRGWLAVALNWRWTVVTASTVLFVTSLFLFTLVRKEFVPSQDQSLVFLTLNAPPGTSLAATRAEMAKLESWAKTRSEIEKFVSSVGAAGSWGATNQGNMAITLVPKDKRKLSHLDIVQVMRKEVKLTKGVRVNARDLSSRGLTAGRTFPVSFNIRGPDYDVLSKKSAEIMEKLEESGMVADLDTDYKTGQPELRVYPDREKAAKYGVTLDAITRTVSAAIGGLRQGQFTNEGRRYDIRISLPVEDRTSSAKLETLQVRNYLSELVPLKTLVRLEEVSTVQALTRINRARSISVFGNPARGKSQAEALATAERIAREILPAGYTFNLEGAAATFDESFKSLYFSLALGIIIAYMVLASQFNSFIHPLAILLALPFSISGAFLALWVFNQSLNLYSMIGILLLMGIAKKNSILLVEFTNAVREGHAKDEIGDVKIGTVKDAQLVACPVRLRPIVMTSTATVVAALPLAIDSGPGSETRVPMALAIIGGNIVSTLFTLFVVPCAYNLMSKLERHTQDEDGQNKPSNNSGGGSKAHDDHGPVSARELIEEKLVAGKSARYGSAG